MCCGADFFGVFLSGNQAVSKVYRCVSLAALGTCSARPLEHCPAPSCLQPSWIPRHMRVGLWRPQWPREAPVITSSLGSGWVRATVPPTPSSLPRPLPSRSAAEPPRSVGSALRLRRVLLGPALLRGGRTATWPHHCGASVSRAASRSRAASLTCALRAGVHSPAVSRFGTLLASAWTDVPRPRLSPGTPAVLAGADRGAAQGAAFQPPPADSVADDPALPI